MLYYQTQGSQKLSGFRKGSVKSLKARAKYMLATTAQVSPPTHVGSGTDTMQIYYLRI